MVGLHLYSDVAKQNLSSFYESAQIAVTIDRILIS